MLSGGGGGYTLTQTANNKITEKARNQDKFCVLTNNPFKDLGTLKFDWFVLVVGGGQRWKAEWS